ncbi:hypothetical protein [Hymenobacter baengnokdamensis]|uniref:hypothetical protein n=1 Tax=Hymenobacter baengnokdamensis TaxID=2615203 RepID=UPI001248D6F0|nr:hypothetical protein [Hymenobacter baengnokdamensis]
MIRTQGDYLRIAPDLDVWVTWSTRMSEAVHKRYHSVMLGQLDGSERLSKGYARWCRAHDAALDQIHRFYKLTNSLPVAGDRLTHADSPGGEELYIEQRELFTTSDSSPMLLVYHLCAAYIEDLEEYQEGDYVEEDNE